MTRPLLLRLSGTLACAALTAQPLGAAWIVQLGPEVASGRVIVADQRRPGVQVRQGQEHTATISQVFATDGPAALDLSNIAGHVRVTGDGGRAIRIQAVKRVRHADGAEARRLLDALRVDMRQAGGRVEVRTEYPRAERRFSGQVDYTVSVPAGATVSVKSISGDITLTGVSGAVRAESVSGDLEIGRCPNLEYAKTVSGNVQVQQVTSGASLSVSSVSGNVVAHDLKVRSLEAGSVSGDLRLSGIDIERLEAKSVSGTIEFSANLVRGGRYEFNAHSGDVRLSFGDDTGFEFDGNTFSGSIRSDFPLTLRHAAGDAGRGRGARSIRGTYGDAAAIVSARSFSGSIVLSRR